MNGTNHATGGFRRITRLGPWWNARLAVFAGAVGLAVLLLARMQSNVSSRMAELGEKFRDLTAESFYVGVQMRGSLRELNEQLLNYKLGQDPNDRKAFTDEASKTKQWLALTDGRLNAAPEHTPRERTLFSQIEVAYDRYLAGVELLLAADATRGQPGAFATNYMTVQKEIKPLRDLVEEFVDAQKEAFNAFLKRSQTTLRSLRRLLNLSQALLLASTFALAVMVYRGMIAPLRQKLTESQAIIERQEKLAALGTLAAGVAHEIRNPLTAIKFRLFSLKKSLPPEFANHEDTGVISAELNRLERIVKDFLQFARPSEPEMVRLPAQRLLEEVSELLQTQLEKTAIMLRLEPSAMVWIHADTQQIKQVMINLIQNAADSIGRNGTITLSVRSDTATLGGRSRAVAVLAVADTGPGIPPEVEKRLFDPFFTTKDGGTGLGLPIASRIVNKHDGLLRYETQLNRGTTFEIVLPRIEDHASATPDH
jgi:signal transduction histidine kinase